MVPLWYKSTVALAPQSKMLPARMPCMREVRRAGGGIWSSSLSRSGSTSRAAACSLSLSSLHAIHMKIQIQESSASLSGASLSTVHCRTAVCSLSLSSLHARGTSFTPLCDAALQDVRTLTAFPDYSVLLTTACRLLVQPAYNSHHCLGKFDTCEEDLLLS